MFNTMDIYSGAGSKVRFTGNHGTDFENEIANQELTIGAVYTVKGVDIGDYRSSVILEGVPGSYNTVHFENV